MKKLLPLLIWVFAACKQPPKDKGNHFDGYISVEDLKENITTLAAADMEGRATGSAGLQKAAQYLQKEFKEAGLASPTGVKDYLQPYNLHNDSLIAASLSINQIAGVYGNDFAISLRNTPSGKVETSSIVFAGYAIEDKYYNDLAGADLKGKTVAFVLGEPKKNGKYFVAGVDTASAWTSDGVTKKMDLLAKKGAAAAIILNPGQPVFTKEFIKQNETTGLYFNKAIEKPIPFLLVSKAFAGRTIPLDITQIYKRANLMQPFDNRLLKEVKQAVTISLTKQTKEISVSNIAGMVEGSTKKNECVVIMAHYDHLGIKEHKIYFGADDNASGTASLLAIARAFAASKAAGKGPERTILFVAVSGEENGLWGSSYYAQAPLFPLEKTSAVINIDMLGRIDSERKSADTLNYMYVVGSNKISSSIKPALQAAAKLNTIITDFKFDDPTDKTRIYYRSDHYSLAKKGIPALFFYDGMLKADYHRPTDTPEKINYPLLQKRINYIYHLVFYIAGQSAFFKRDLPL